MRSLLLLSAKSKIASIVRPYSLWISSRSLPSAAAHFSRSRPDQIRQIGSRAAVKECVINEMNLADVSTAVCAVRELDHSIQRFGDDRQLCLIWESLKVG